jgi:hypothetical protein
MFGVLPPGGEEVDMPKKVHMLLSTFLGYTA